MEWIKAGIMENGEYAESDLGSPQGGVISPLLANVYLHYLDCKWGIPLQHLGKLIRYCDDFVVICRTKERCRACFESCKIHYGRLELELHSEKTQINEHVGWKGRL